MSVASCPGDFVISGDDRFVASSSGKAVVSDWGDFAVVTVILVRLTD
jgi:hypothetical protein